MRERAPGTWELIVSAGRDPSTGSYRRVIRTVEGLTKREAKVAQEPVRQQCQQARAAVGDAVERLDTHDRQVAEMALFRQDDTGLAAAVDTWQRWAAGHPVAPTDLDAAAHELSCYVATTSEARALLATLAPDHPALRRQVRAVDRADVDYGIEL